MRYEEILIKLNPIHNYESRNDYLEKSIKDTMKYFNPDALF